MPKIFCVNWFRKGDDGKFVWPGYGDNMRVMKWMLDRIEGKAQGEDHAFGISPKYDEINWEGLDFSREQFESVTDMNPEHWQQELALHTEHFEKLAYHLPQELVATKAKMEQRILGQ